jgi:hypothetical protein
MSEKTEHDERTHYRCPLLGGPAPFSHCRTTADGEPCSKTISCWQHLFDASGFLAEHYDMPALEAKWREPRQPKLLTLVDLVRQARDESDTP